MWYRTKKLIAQQAFDARTHNLSEEEKEIAWKKELEESWEEISNCVLSFKAGPNILEGGRFDTLSLGTWYEIVKAADIMYIPIVLVGFAGLIENIENPRIKINLPEQAEQYAGMVRLDPCGTQFIKAQFSYRGTREFTQVLGAFQNEEYEWFLDLDERTFNGLMTYIGQINKDGNSECPIWWRPWIKALTVDIPRDFMGKFAKPDTWPVEWRAIVQNGTLTAISAYYIQAPLPLNPIYKQHISDIKTAMTQILDFMNINNIQPWHPKYIGDDPSKVSFVCDFISTPSGIAWLEAGPEVPVDQDNIPVSTWGSHPCFFMNKPIAGVALSSTEILPLSAF